MRRLSDKEFKEIYSKVPRVTVDVAIQSKEGVLLVKRSIEPGKGCWHLPGGSVYYGETVRIAALRVAKEETGLKVRINKFQFFRDFIGLYKLPGYNHVVDFITTATPISGVIANDENGIDICWFRKIPKGLLPEHKEVLNRLGYK